MLKQVGSMPARLPVDLATIWRPTGTLCVTCRRVCRRCQQVRCVLRRFSNYSNKSSTTSKTILRCLMRSRLLDRTATCVARGFRDRDPHQLEHSRSRATAFCPVHTTRPDTTKLATDVVGRCELSIQCNASFHYFHLTKAVG